MQTLIASLALSCVLLPSPQGEQPTSTHFNAPDGMKQAQIDRIMKNRMEEHLTFALYHPRNVPAESLVKYVDALTNRPLTYYDLNPRGHLVPDVASRYVVMGVSVGVQDFSDRIDDTLGQLAVLDDSLNPIERAQIEDANTSHETLRLINIKGQFVTDLVGTACPFVRVGYMQGTSLITLTGPSAEVTRAVSILKEADKPLPQIVLQWTLLEAVDSVDASEAASDAVANALLPFAPGKKFRRGQTFTVRGVAGDDRRLRVSSGLKGLQGVDPGLPSEVSLSAVARGFDSGANLLELNDCEITLQRTVAANTARGEQRSMTTDQLATSLSLRAGETTVLGSLGGDPIWVALTFTLIP